MVTYSADGGAPSSTPLVFGVGANQSVTVTITNDPTAVMAVTTTPPVTTEPTMPDTLPPTGSDPTVPVTGGLLLVTVGFLAIIYTTRQRSSDDRADG